MEALICKIIKLHDAFFLFCEKYFSHLLLLAIRLWLAYTFLPSGYGKLLSWDTTLYLFQNVYNVPLIPFNVAAFLATGVEIIFSILLIVGLFSRFSVFPLIILQLVIGFTYAEDIAQYYWYLLMLVIAFYGAGCVSLDYLLAKKYKKTSQIKCCQKTCE